MMNIQVEYFFNLKRFFKLLKLDLYCSYRNLLIILITTASFSALINFLTFNTVEHIDIHSIFYGGFTVILGGFLFTSLAFSEVHKKGSNLQYLLLPASSFEKFLAKLILTSLIYLVASIPIYFILSSLAKLLNLLFFTKSQHEFFNPFTLENLKTWLIYLILQSTFLFGSIFFKNMAFVKTILTILLTLILFSTFFSIVFLIINNDLFLKRGFLNIDLNESSVSYNDFFNLVFQIIKVLFYVCFAPFFWFLTWLRLRELEV